MTRSPDGGFQIRPILRQAQDGYTGSVAVHGADARGESLFCTPTFPAGTPAGHAGVDLLYVQPHAAFPLHTHSGHHILYLLQGTGTVTYGGQVYPTSAGDLVMIEATVDHAVAAGPSGQWILAFGAPHAEIDAPDRMHVVD